MSLSPRPAVTVTHPAPNTHSVTVRTPNVNAAVNTDDPKVQGYLIGAGVTIAAAALGVGLYELYSYLKPRYTQYKLSYFNGRGLAEVSRYLFALSGVDYVDHRFTDVPSGEAQPKRPEFEQLKESLPFGQVPTLQVGGENGIVLSQSKAIERYLARQFGFMGCNAVEAQLIDSLGEALRDARDAFMKVRDNAEEKPKFFTDTLPKHAHLWNRFVTTHGTSKDLSTAVGNKISLADVQLFHFLSMFDDQEGVSRALAQYPAIKAIRANIASQPQIVKWIAERPKSAF